jgi:two-component system cell cycle response regulator CpdR
MEEPGILLVDDDESTLTLLQRIFTAAGLQVHCAEDGSKALAELGRKRFRLLVTDYRMPGLDGLELARRARKIVPDLQIVLTTAGAPPAIDSRKAAGICRVLAKPFVIGTVLDLVRQLKENAKGP